MLGEEVDPVALAPAERRGGHLEPHGLGSQELDALAPEGLPHLVHRGQQAPIRLARHDAVVVEQLVGDVAHHQPPGVAVARGGDHGVVEGRREPVEHAAGEQQALAARVGGRAADPVGAGHDPLGDQHAAVREHHALERVARPAARREHGVLGDVAQAADESRVERGAPARSGDPGPMRRGVGEMTAHAAVAQQQVLALAQDRAVGVGNPLQPHRGAGVMEGRGPLHEPARPGEEPLQAGHDRGRPGDALAPAAHVEVEHRVVGIALAQRAEAPGLQPGPQGVGDAHGRRPEPTFATAGSS